MVYFVSLGAREVDDDGSLVVVDVGDVGEFAVSYHKGSIGRGEIAGHPTLARVPGFVEVPEDLTRVNGIGDVGYELFLSRVEDSVRVDAVQLGHSPGIVFHTERTCFKDE